MVSIRGFTKKYWYILLLVIGIGLYFILKKWVEPISLDQVHTVGRQSITDSIQAVGEVRLLNEQNLSFTIWWIIDKVYVTIGDEVKVWKVLAEISSAKQRNQIAQAQKSYEISNNRLNQLQWWWKESTLLQLQNDIQQNQLKLNELDQQIPLIKLQISNNITKNSDQIVEVENQIALLGKKQQVIQNEIEEIKLRQWDDWEKTIEINRTAVNIAKDDIQSIWIRLDEYTSLFDSIYGVSLVKKNEWNRLYFWARNNQVLADSEDKARDLLSEISQLNIWQLTNLTASTWDIDAIIAMNDSLIAVISKVQTLASQTQDIIQNRSLEAWDFTAVRSNWYQSQMSAILSWSSASILNLQNNKKALLTMDSEQLTDIKNTNTLQNKELELQENKKQLVIQQSTLNQLVLTNQQLTLDKTYQVTQQTNTQKTLASQIQLLQVQNTEQKNYNGGTKYDVAQARQELELQRLQIQQAQLALKDYQLIAYEDGTIIDFDFKVGENLAISAKNNYITIGTPRQYQVELMLDQVDVIRLKEWMTAQIALNAITDTTFTGTITKISTVPIKENNVNSYKVTVVFDNADKMLVSGMIGTVTINMQTKDDVIAAPLTAIVYSGSQWFVTLYQSWDTLDTVKLQAVTVWVSNLLWIEIVSWLKQWQQILSIGKNTSWQAEAVFGPPPKEIRDR